MNKTRYAWYSTKMAIVAGTNFWSTPTGETVEITTVTDSPTDSYTKWDDICYLGPVVEFVKHGRDGELWDVEDIDPDTDTDASILQKVERLFGVIERSHKRDTMQHRWN